METQTKNKAHAQNGIAKTINKAAQNGQSNHQPATKGANGFAEPPKQILSPADQSPEPPKPEQPKPDEIKFEVAPATEARPLLNLEAKLKVVEDLHRRSIQRLNLIARLNQIEAFEVALAQENDELEDNPYQGCKLIIEDDKKRQFVTTTPGLIRLVSQFIFSACHEKLAEIESTIVFPKA